MIMEKHYSMISTCKYLLDIMVSKVAFGNV